MKTKNTTGLLIDVLFVMLLFMAGCSLFTAPSNFTHTQKVEFTSLQTLKSASTFRKFALESSAVAYKKGLIQEDTKNKIIKIGDTLQETINTAADALIAYHNSEITETDLSTKIMNYQKVFNEFLEIVTPYIEGK